MEQRKLININELAKIIPYSPNALKKMAREKVIPGINMAGRKWIFNANDVLDALEKLGNMHE